MAGRSQRPYPAARAAAHFSDHEEERDVMQEGVVSAVWPGWRNGRALLSCMSQRRGGSQDGQASHLMSIIRLTSTSKIESTTTINNTGETA